MKKILCVFLSCCLCQSVFAVDPGGIGSYKTVQAVPFPRDVFEEVIRQDELFANTPGVVDKMLRAYDYWGGIGMHKFGEFGLSEIKEICRASGLIHTVDECYKHVFNPVMVKTNIKIYHDVCSVTQTGGTNYCIDDVFVVGRNSGGNPYHQNVHVGDLAALGFAMEYAAQNGHDVWCDIKKGPVVWANTIEGLHRESTRENTILCVTPDMKNFYAINFAGVGTFDLTSLDESSESELIKGICALKNARMSDVANLKGCYMKCDPKLLSKFSLVGENRQVPSQNNGNGGTEMVDFCDIRLERPGESTLHRYPGYEYMTDAFKDVRTLLSKDLIDVLKLYVQKQGINVSSFDCSWVTKPLDKSLTLLGEALGWQSATDDVLDCKINGTPVSFVFDSLHETFAYVRDANNDAMSCIFMGGKYENQVCRGLADKSVCISKELRLMVSGSETTGTYWDENAHVCRFTDSEYARKVDRWITLTSGLALTVGITFAANGHPLVVLAEAVGSVLTDLTFFGLDELEILKPALRVQEFYLATAGCKIPKENKSIEECSTAQKACAALVANSFAGRAMEYLNDNDLDEEQRLLVDSLWGNIGSCLSEEQKETALATAFLSPISRAQGAVDMADMAVLAASIIIAPSNVLNKISKLPKISKFLAARRIKLLAGIDDILSSGTKYRRVNLRDFEDIKDLNDYAKVMKSRGYFYNIIKDPKTSEDIFVLSNKNIFKGFDYAEFRVSYKGSPFRISGELTDASTGMKYRRIDFDDVPAKKLSELTDDLEGADLSYGLHMDPNTGKQYLLISELSTDLNTIARKLNLPVGVVNLDSDVRIFLRQGREHNVMFRKSNLSDLEWHTLNEYLKTYEVELVENPAQPNIMIFRRIGESKWDIQQIRNTYSRFLNQPNLDKVRNGSVQRLLVHKTLLSYDEEWAALKRSLNQEGLDLIDHDETYFWIVKMSGSGTSTPISNVPASVAQVPPVPFVRQRPTLTSQGIKVGKWNFTQVTDSGTGIQYYERVIKVNGSFDPIEGAKNLVKDIEVEIVVFRVDDETYILAIFDNSEDMNAFLLRYPDAVPIRTPDVSVNMESLKPITIGAPSQVSEIKNVNSTSNASNSLSEINDAHWQRLSDNVLNLQNSQGMAQKVDNYNDVFKRAKETLPNDEYTIFEQMVEYIQNIQREEHDIQQIEQNLRKNGRSEADINSLLNNRRATLATNKTTLENMRTSHQQAAQFLDDNYSELRDPMSVLLDSDDLVLQKRANVIREISTQVDEAQLRRAVQQFKDDVVANFPESVYQKAKNWDNMNASDKANFLAYDVLPYIQEQQGLGYKTFDVTFPSRAEMGGLCSFCHDTECFSISSESLNNYSFNKMFEFLTHESIHSGQGISGTRSLLSEEMVNVASDNYVGPMVDRKTYRNNPLEIEAYITNGMFSNILDDVAEYHHW